MFSKFFVSIYFWKQIKSIGTVYCFVKAVFYLMAPEAKIIGISKL